MYTQDSFYLDSSMRKHAEQRCQRRIKIDLPHFLIAPNPNIYMTGRALVLDVETTNINIGSPLTPENRLLLACWRFDGQVKSRWGGEFDMEPLLADIARAEFIVAAGLNYEKSLSTILYSGSGCFLVIHLVDCKTWVLKYRVNVVPWDTKSMPFRHSYPTALAL